MKKWYWNNAKKGLNYGFSALGVIWFIIKSSTYFYPSISDFIRPQWWLFLTAGMIVALIKGWPIKTISQKIPNIHVPIEITVKDIFKQKGSLIIPTSITFDTSIEENLVNQASVQGQYTKKYYGHDVTKLDNEIKHALKNESYDKMDKGQKSKGKLEQYKMGTVAPIQNYPNMNYLFAMATTNEHGNVSTTIENIMVALPRLWESIKNKGEYGLILIPVLGTKYGRIHANHEQVIQEIIKSFVAACNFFGKFCEKLTIVIYPKDFTKGTIDLNQLNKFLEFTCTFNSKVSGNHSDQAVGTSLG